MAANTPNPTQSYGSLPNLREAVDATLRPLLRGIDRIAVVGFPSHRNIGDSAIWRGEMAYLRSRGVAVAYSCSVDTFSAEELRRKVGNSPIWFHGGGNFGDLWPVQHELRLEIIRTFANNPIVLFPQSLHFTTEHNAIESRRTLAGHGDVTLLVRDRQSRDLARTALGVDTDMCPDLAHWLTPPAGRQGKGTVFLLRTDQESTGLSALAASGGTSTSDWSDAFPPHFPRRVSLSMWYTLHRKAATGLNTRARYRGTAELAASKVRDRLASNRLAIGLSLLDPYDVVVTDRLHGHLLALLLGKKTVALDNSYGKVRAYYDAWTSELPGSYWADSFDEALSIAESVVG